METNLKPNDVLLFRDFVNQYNEQGSKISNLVFVIIRASPDGVGLVIDYVDNFAKAKCDSHFHAVALDYLLQRDDIFKNGTHLIISGDHGPHFWCWDTLMYQSTVFKKYGVSIEVCGLCSYHATLMVLS